MMSWRSILIFVALALAFGLAFGLVTSVVYMTEPPDPETTRNNVIKDSKRVHRPNDFLENFKEENKPFILQGVYNLQDSASNQTIIRVEVGTVGESLAVQISSQMLSAVKIRVVPFNP